ncbi:MAG: ABC-F family ATP-binding cassette domain-containing protein [Chlamydiia bacterium]
MLTLQKISKRVGQRTLFDGVTCTFDAGHRYGLTGPNGAGKSTLLRIMMGLEEATSGVVLAPKRLGFLKQNLGPYLKHRVVDVVLMGNQRLWAALQERDRLYDGEMTDQVGMRLGELEEVIAAEDGYAAESKAEELLLGMGIPQNTYEEPLGNIANDQQFRVLLCQALFGDPEALLLDEPTNHLDLSSIEWLENFLHAYKGCLIVVSHDRHFLNAVTTDIADIDYDTIINYPGNYDAMLVMKTATRERAESDAKTQEKKVAQLREFVARFSAGTRASQVQSRMREIDRLQPQDLKKSNIQRPYIRIPTPEKPSGEIVFKFEHVSKGYGDRQVIKNLSFEVARGDKIGVIGTNGRGKTTLLKLLAGRLAPDAGRVVPGHNLVLGYFPQLHEEVVEKSATTTAFDWLKARRSGLYDQDVRSALGKLLFGGDDAFKATQVLSGGETARLILAGLVLTEVNTLILDEPNNHLDLESVSALCWGLEEFKGTIIVASHDRDLISRVATKIIAFEPEGVIFFPGPYEQYHARRTSHSSS